MRRIRALATAAMALAVLVALPAAAQAEEASPYWYVHQKRLGPGEVVPIKIGGLSTVYLFGYGQRVSCRTKGSGLIANNEETGGAEISELALRSCRGEAGGPESSKVARLCPRGSKAEIVPQGLPWLGSLREDMHVNFKDVTFTLACSGLEAGGETLEGELTALVGVGKWQFGNEFGAGPGEEEESNLLSGVALFTGVWRVTGPAGQRQVTALEPGELP